MWRPGASEQSESHGVSDSCKPLHDALALIESGDQAVGKQLLERMVDDDHMLSGIAMAELILRIRLTKDEAADYLPRLQSCVEHESYSERQRARILHAIGFIYFQLRETRESLKALQASTVIFAETHDDIGLGQALDTLGSAFLWSGALELARRAFVRALALKQSVQDQLGQAITLGNLARLAVEGGQWDEAVGFFLLDLKLVDEKRDSLLHTRLRNELGRVYYLAGKYEAGFELLGQVMEEMAHANDDMSLFFCHKDLAMCAHLMGQDNTADKHLAAAVKYCHTQDPYQKAWLALIRGRLTSKSAPDAANADLAFATDEFCRLCIPDLEIESRLAFGELLADLGQMEQAIEQVVVSWRLVRDFSIGRHDKQLYRLVARLEIEKPGIGGANRSLAMDVVGSAGGYLLLEKLGQGAHGEVFRALDTDTGKQLAIKRILLDPYKQQMRREVYENLLREFELVARLDHPGIIDVYSFGRTTQGELYLAMELLAGGTIRGLMQASQGGAKDILRHLRIIAHSLHALHSQGVIHRDLKPENIMLRRDGTPVLVDFSISLFNTAGMVAGTGGYMSPEQSRGKKLDARSDIFSLGVIAYEWLAGQLPTAAVTSRGSWLKNILGKEHLPEPFVALGESVRPMVPLLCRMLAEDPDDRFDDCNQLAEQCEILLKSI